MKIYSGYIEAKQMNEAQALSGGSGGSATAMSLSAPIKIKVQCIPHGRDFTLVYALVALIAGALLVRNVLRKRKNKGNSSKKKDKKKN
jgi:hypothetical protein